MRANDDAKCADHGVPISGTDAARVRTTGGAGAASATVRGWATDGDEHDGNEHAARNDTDRNEDAAGNDTAGNDTDVVFADTCE